MWSDPEVGCSSQSWVQITLLSTGGMRASVLLMSVSSLSQALESVPGRDLLQYDDLQRQPSHLHFKL